MDFLTRALAAIPQAATSWLASLLFIVTVTAWLIISWRVRRNATLLKRIKDLPEKDRGNVLKAEMGGAYLDKGLSAEAFLIYQRQRYVFVGYIFTVGLVLTILGFAVYLAASDRVEGRSIEHPNAISIGTPKPTPLGDLIRLVEREQNVTVVFGSTCPADVRAALVDTGTHEGNDTKEFLEKLQFRARPAVQYRVTSSGANNERLEIICY